VADDTFDSNDDDVDIDGSGFISENKQLSSSGDEQQEVEWCLHVSAITPAVSDRCSTGAQYNC